MAGDSLTERADISNILEELHNELHKIYGIRLKRLLLFGSYARDEAEQDSDIDIAVVLDDFEDALTEIEHASDLVFNLCLQHNCVISILPVREREYQTAKFPIPMNLRREGVPI
jgi:predicted nucleotidyltransferase